jgi:hypothetical protein
LEGSTARSHRTGTMAEDTEVEEGEGEGAPPVEEENKEPVTELPFGVAVEQPGTLLMLLQVCPIGRGGGVPREGGWMGDDGPDGPWGHRKYVCGQARDASGLGTAAHALFGGLPSSRSSSPPPRIGPSVRGRDLKEEEEEGLGGAEWRGCDLRGMRGEGGRQ